MSTRATYRFIDRNAMLKDTTVYIHHDGYPTGAAFYLYNMLTSPSKGSTATQFIRANDNAELTVDHAHHGDTDYQWTIEGSGPEAIITGKKHDWENKRYLPCQGPTPLREFIAENTGLIDNFQPFKQVSLSYSRKEWFNETTATAYLTRKYSPLEHLRVWSKHEVNRNSANWKSMVADLKAVLAVFPDLVKLMTDEEAELFLSEEVTA